MTSTTTTKLTNVKINRDTILHDGMRDGEFFVTVFFAQTGRHYVISIDNQRPVLTNWPVDNGRPVNLTIDDATIYPGDALLGEHGRKFNIGGTFWQLDLSGPTVPRFIDC